MWAGRYRIAAGLLFLAALGGVALDNYTVGGFRSASPAMMIALAGEG